MMTKDRAEGLVRRIEYECGQHLSVDVAPKGGGFVVVCLDRQSHEAFDVWSATEWEEEVRLNYPCPEPEDANPLVAALMSSRMGQHVRWSPEAIADFSRPESQEGLRSLLARADKLDREEAERAARVV